MSEMTIEKARAYYDVYSCCFMSKGCTGCPYEIDSDKCNKFQDDSTVFGFYSALKTIIADLEQREKELATGLMTNCENCVTRLENGDHVCARCPTRKYRDKAAETLRKFGGE